MNIADYTYEKYLDGQANILDAHCHLGMIQNPAVMALTIDATKGYECLSFGTEPLKYRRESIFENPSVHVGCGFHPWQICEQSADDQLEVLLAYINRIELIGEIGLDFSKSYAQTKETQMQVFKEACKALAKKEERIVSLHAVKSMDVIMSEIKKSGAGKNNTFIFHQASPSFEQLTKAIEQGFYFSCGPKMADTKNGFNALREIPEDRLLIETDLPWDEDEIDPIEYFNLINDFLIQLREIRF